MTPVFLALGSNINPEQNLRAAAELLRARWPAIRFSPVYRTTAREVTDQDDFLNAVAMLDTDEPPEAIAHHLRGIERTLKKAPPFKFGPRTIDLDLLLYGNQVIETPELTVPHPRMHERRFVLEPLCDLIHDKKWRDALGKTLDQKCVKTALEL